MISRKSNVENKGIPSRIIIVAGTYDGVLAGWDTISHEKDEEASAMKGKKKKNMHLDSETFDNDNDDDKLVRLQMSFAMAAHEGSVRCLSICSSSPSSKENNSNNAYHNHQPGLLLSGGFDESLRVFDLKKHTEAGETKTPQDMGTPTCATFAPPNSTNPTHCLVGLTSGKILLYKKKDWSIAHILGGGHSSDGTTTGEGVSCLAVHPTGKMALSAGVRDGKICLWDLMKGRLAYVHKVTITNTNNNTNNNTKTTTKSPSKDRISSLAWSHDGSRYAFCHGKKLTARDALSGEDLLDIMLPSRINQICFLKGEEDRGLYYVACACDDGSLPVLAVGAIVDDTSNSNNEQQQQQQQQKGIIRAVMAIEPVEKNLAGEDRIKCIQSLNDGFLVVTANSGGVISVMDLSGAVQMIMEESNRGNNDDNEDEEDNDDNEDLFAVQILDSVRVGTGARITNIACWSSGDSNRDHDEEQDTSDFQEDIDVVECVNDNDDDPDNNVSDPTEKQDLKRKRTTNISTIKVNGKEKMEMDEQAMAKARGLVEQAKKRQKRKQKKKSKKNQT